MYFFYVVFIALAFPLKAKVAYFISVFSLHYGKERERKDDDEMDAVECSWRSAFQHIINSCPRSI